MVTKPDAAKPKTIPARKSVPIYRAPRPPTRPARTIVTAAQVLYNITTG